MEDPFADPLDDPLNDPLENPLDAVAARAASYAEARCGALALTLGRKSPRQMGFECAISGAGGGAVTRGVRVVTNNFLKKL